MKPHASLRQSKLMRSLVPCSQSIRVQQVSTDEQTISIILQTISPVARCPACSTPSKHIHSRYARVLSDLPWGSFTVHLHLYARKFFCTVRNCSRRIFTERLPDIVAPYARRSNRLGEILQLIGFALGGEAGSRLVERLRMTVSPSTLLRLVRRTPDPVEANHTPRVLGVDDFATRKGRTYGTILVDLEQHRPIELLPDRSAQTLENWLKAHPGVEIISRDRSTEYTKGATAGAPAAIQVADRFHLLMNLREAVERLLDRNRSQFRGIVLPLLPLHPLHPQLQGAADLSTLPLSAFRDPRPRSPAEAAAQKARRKRRQARYKQVLALHTQGLSQRDIANYLKITRTTVARYLHLDSDPTVGQRWYSPSMLDPYLPYLYERWTGGCQNGMKLWRELKEQGYPGSHSMVTKWACQQRRKQGKPKKERKPRMATSTDYAKKDQTTKSISSIGTPQPAPAARQLVWYLLKDPQTMTPAEQEVLPKLKVACSELALAYDLVQEFIKMVKHRKPEALEPWLTSVAASNLRDLANFAAGIERDKAAVLAALSLGWSNGQTEGQVNRLKLLKRQMYGRAKFDLLRKRVLHRAFLQPDRVHQK
jgi:transposase